MWGALRVIRTSYQGKIPEGYDGGSNGRNPVKWTHVCEFKVFMLDQWY